MATPQSDRAQRLLATMGLHDIRHYVIVFDQSPMALRKIFLFRANGGPIGKILESGKFRSWEDSHYPYCVLLSSLNRPPELFSCATLDVIFSGVVPKIVDRVQKDGGNCPFTIQVDYPHHDIFERTLSAMDLVKSGRMIVMWPRPIQ